MCPAGHEMETADRSRGSPELPARKVNRSGRSRISMRAVFTPMLLVLGLWLRSSAGACAQGLDAEPLLLRKLALCGARFSLTESWGTLELTLANPNPTGRNARLCVFYASRPDEIG